jgi:hypothetical protein
MAIQFSYTTPATGAITQYHVVQNIQLDYSASSTAVTVASYVDSTTYAANKLPVYTQSISIDGLPDTTQDPLVTVQQQLVAVAPTADASGAANRYLFAGATLVDMPATVPTATSTANSSTTASTGG